MPANVVPSYVNARRRVVAMEMAEQGHQVKVEISPDEQEVLDLLAGQNQGDSNG